MGIYKKITVLLLMLTLPVTSISNITIAYCSNSLSSPQHKSTQQVHCMTSDMQLSYYDLSDTTACPCTCKDMTACSHLGSDVYALAFASSAYKHSGHTEKCTQPSNELISIHSPPQIKPPILFI